MTLSTRDLVGQRFDRAAEVRARDDRTVEVAFASEEPYLRHWGWEVIDVRSIDMTRLNGGASVLVNHDPDKLVGVVESARVDGDGKARARIKLGRSALASEVAQDIVDGIRRHVSFGYEITEAEQTGERDGWPVFRVKTRPFEISLTSIPADATVGVGRSHEVKTMSDIQITRDEQGEAQRVKTLYKMGKQFNQADLAERAVNDGWTIEQMQQRILEATAVRPAQIDRAEIGLTPQERQSFSLVKLLRHMANPGDRKLRNEAGFELAVVSGSEKGEGFHVPHEVLWQRDLTVGGTTTGSKLVGTDHLANEFVEALRARSVFAQAGARMLTGLRGHVAIPRQSGTANTYWVGEASAVTESNPTYDQITMTPHTVGTFVDISRRLLIQSDPSVEQLVRNDLAQSISTELDRVAIEGNPDASATANEPRGILYTTGVGSVAAGAAGAAPTRAHLVSLWKEIAQDNADMGNLAYLSNAKVAAALASTLLDSGSGRYVYEGDGRLLGYPFYISNNVPSDLTKGTGSNLSAIIFGNFADAMFGFWSGLDVILDNATLATQGGLRIVCLQDADFAVRRPQSWSILADAIAA